MSKIFLRALEIGDLERTYKWHSDENLFKTLGGPFRHVSMAAEKDWLLNKEKFSNLEINLAICLIDTHQHIGIISVRDIDWISRNGNLAGIFIGEPEFRGQGFGTDALKSIVKHCFFDLGLNRIYAQILESNIASQKMFEVCGFKIEGKLRQHSFKDGKFNNVILVGLCVDEYLGVENLNS